MNINTDHLNRCTDTLRSAWEGLQQREPGEVLYDICGAACVVDLVLEQRGRLLEKPLIPSSNRFQRNAKLVGCRASPPFHSHGTVPQRVG